MTDKKDNVKAIRPSVKIDAKLEPVQQVVDYLEYVTDLAKKGEITFVGFVGFGNETYYHEIIGSAKQEYIPLISNLFRLQDMAFFDLHALPEIVGTMEE